MGCNAMSRPLLIRACFSKRLFAALMVMVGVSLGGYILSFHLAAPHRTSLPQHSPLGYVLDTVHVARTAKEAIGTGHTDREKEASGTGHTDRTKEASGTGHTDRANGASGTGHTDRAKEASGTGHTDRAKEASDTGQWDKVKASSTSERRRDADSSSAERSPNQTRTGGSKSGKKKPAKRVDDLLDPPKTTTQLADEQKTDPKLSTQYQTSDHWPVFSKDYFPGPIPPSPFHPNFTIKWDFNTSAFLQRPDVKGQPPKLMTWMVKTRYMPPLPEPVRLRVCPEMPCRMTTNKEYRKQSAALLWAGQIMREPTPPVRSHPDQVYLFHNHEPQKPDWIHSPSFRKRAWRSAFNWTMSYRTDSDIVDLYGRLVKRETPPRKNYTHILAQKSHLAAQLVSNCRTFGRREDYVKLIQKHAPVDLYGGCAALKCPRSSDDACFQMFNNKYKFFLAFENSFCTDYISEKFFRYLSADLVVVARASNEYKKHAAPGTFINTADFKSAQELAEYLLYLDSHPEKYIQLLRAKDQYQSLYEDWPIRSPNGQVRYMTYHYEAVAWCEMCRRLWDLDHYRQTIPDINRWFDKHNCYPPNDLK